MTTSKFNTENASKLAAMIIGFMSIGQAHAYHMYQVNDVHFYIDVVECRGQKSYYCNPEHEDFPREEGKDLISDKTYQNTCHFFNLVNQNLSKHTF